MSGKEEEIQVHENVKEYYGKRVKTTEDLMTNSCTLDRSAFSSEAKEALQQIHPEILAKNYGCGAVYPEAVMGCKVLDLGSGAGLDCFALSKLVGPDGHVIGVDMTQEQLEVARKHVDYHTQLYGYSKPNVEFLEGFIEKLDVLELKENTFDIIVSNCVINLSPDKEAVLRGAYRLLKTGGEMYFSDIYCNQPVPQALRENKTLWGECISGALEWRELIRLATEIGFVPPVLVTSLLYTSDDPKVKDMLDSAGCSELQFCSATYRLMKTDQEEQQKSSLVQVLYNGTITGHKSQVKFSHHGALKAGSPVLMWSSVSSLIQASPRLAPHFTFTQQPSQEEGEEATPLTPPLSDFINIDPFEVASKTVALVPPKSGSCCGDEPPAKKLCCDGTTGNGTTEPPAKKSCCGPKPCS